MTPTNQIILGFIIIAFCAIGGTFGGIMVKNGFEKKTVSRHALSPQAEKLLEIVHKYQKEFGLNKLVIGRDGILHFDEEERRKKYKINIIGELYNINSNYHLRESEFENLILSIPINFLRNIPETRFDNPYVVSITEEGIEYLKK